MLRKKPSTVNVYLAAAVFVDQQGRTLLLPPPDSAKQGTAADTEVAALVSKMWHFPTVKLRKNPEVELRTYLAKKEWLPDISELRFEPLPKVRHGVTYRRVEIRPYCVAVAELPQIPGAKIASLAELSSLSSVAVSNLTRKIARTALAGPAMAPVRASVLSFRAASS